MADSKLSDLTQGTRCDVYYGTQGGNSRKFFDAGFYNVKNYGAVGDGSHDDTANIQSAVNDALTTGGILFFPPGNFKVSNPGAIGAISFNGVKTSGIRVVGSGVATLVYTATTQYVFDIDYGTPFTGGINYPVASFEYLKIESQAGITAITDSESCAGCIHISGGVAVPRIHSCRFNIGGGIAVFSAAQNITIDNCLVVGSYTGNNADRSIGYFVNSASIKDCKVESIGYGVISIGSGGGVLEMSNVDIEVCGTGISVGYTPISFLSIITP